MATAMVRTDRVERMKELIATGALDGNSQRLRIAADLTAGGASGSLSWFEGVPPVTGYYWYRVQDRRWSTRPFAIAELFIDPSAKRLVARSDGIPGGRLYPRQGDSDQWAGPLPVPMQEQWMGIDTSPYVPPAFPSAEKSA